MADGPSPSIEASIKRERPARRVFSIQSHVVHGYAGNKAAVFPLQINGFHVDFVNSVHFSNHTAYANLRGERLDSEQLGSIYEGLSLNGLTTYSHLLTGYCGNPGFLQRIGGIVKDLKEKNEHLLYVCDPVLGDHGKYYTPRELLPIYKEVIVPLADVLTPNCFELGELSGRKIENEADCLSAVDAIHDLGVSRIVVTSGIPSKEEETQLIALTSTRNKDGTTTRHRFVFPKRSGNFVGTGDLFASLLIVWLEECGGDLAAAVGRVIGALQDVIGVTIDVAKEMKERTKMDGANQDSQMEAVANAVSDIKMLVELEISKWEKGEEKWEREQEYYDDDAQDHYDDWEKEKEKRKERNKEWEKKENPESWTDRQGMAILRLGQSLMHSSYLQPVYSTPEERLQRYESERRSKTGSLPHVDIVETQVDFPPSDPAERFKKYLRQVPQTLSEMQKRRINFYIQENSMMMSIISSHTGTLPLGWTHATQIATQLNRLEQSLPSDLQQKLHEMQPEEISRVAMLDWLDSIRGENRMKLQSLPNSDQEVTSELRTPSTLLGLMHFGTVAAMLPEELIVMVDDTLKTYYEERKKKCDAATVNVDIAKLQHRELINARRDLGKKLGEFMTRSYVNIFGKRMYPKPWTRESMNPGRKPTNWTPLIQSLNMMEEMRDFATQELKNSSICVEFAKHLYRSMQTIPVDELERLYPDAIFQYLLPAYVVREWLGNISKEVKAARTLNPDQESQPKRYSLPTLAALLFGCAAAEEEPAVMLRKFKRLSINKTSDGLSEASNVEGSDDSIPEAWMKKAASILELGLKMIGPSLEETASNEELPVIPTVQSELDEKEEAETAAEDSERERELKIREKALKLKEEVFDRKVAEFELKMKELGEKMVAVDKRVEDIEEKGDTENLESRMDEMEKRLKNLEEKVDENDLVFL